MTRPAVAAADRLNKAGGEGKTYGEAKEGQESEHGGQWRDAVHLGSCTEDTGRECFTRNWPELPGIGGSTLGLGAGSGLAVPRSRFAVPGGWRWNKVYSLEAREEFFGLIWFDRILGSRLGWRGRREAVGTGQMRQTNQVWGQTGTGKQQKQIAGHKITDAVGRETPLLEQGAWGDRRHVC